VAFITTELQIKASTKRAPLSSQASPKGATELNYKNLIIKRRKATELYTVSTKKVSEMFFKI